MSAAGNLNLHRQIHLAAGLFKDARLDPTLRAEARRRAAEIVARAGLTSAVPTVTDR